MSINFERRRVVNWNLEKARVSCRGKKLRGTLLLPLPKTEVFSVSSRVDPSILFSVHWIPLLPEYICLCLSMEPKLIIWLSWKTLITRDRLDKINAQNMFFVVHGLKKSDLKFQLRVLYISIYDLYSVGTIEWPACQLW